MSSIHFEECPHGPGPGTVDCYRAAVNNELVRLIWASYKEEYLRPGDATSFLVRHGAGNETQVDSLAAAQRLLYDARLKDDLEIAARVDGRLVELRDTATLLDLMRPWLQRAFAQLTVSDERWRHWLVVSEHAVRNEAAALADKVGLDAAIAPHGSVLGYASGLAANDTFAFFCRYAAYFGRYDMPFSKMRLPIDNTEAARHAPEFGADVALTLAAIDRRHVVLYGGDAAALAALIDGEFPEASAAWTRALVQAGRDPAAFAPLPVHPLSLPIYAAALPELVASGEVLLETGATIRASAGLSYRTMIPAGEESRLAIKLPVPLQLTGYVRYIDMEELRCAPQLSDQLARIFAAEHDFGGRLRLDRELMTVGVVPRSDSAQHTQDTPYLSCLLRENQSRALPTGSVTMPLAAIFSASSISGKPLLVEAMEKAGVQTQAQAQAYFAHYLDLLLGSVLRMFLRHGVMLEAHQQNLGITFDTAGRAELLHYHDIACAVFFHRPSWLAAGHPGPTLQGLSHPYSSDDARHSCAQFVHTVLLLNVLPVIDLIADDYDIAKSRLLQLSCEAIARMLWEERERRRHAGGPAAAVFLRFHADFEAHVLASPTFSAKRLLGRLFTQSQTPSWGQVPNRDPGFAAVKGSSVQIANPRHPFHVPDVARVPSN